MIEYRHARADDAAALAALYRDSFADTFGHLYSVANLAIFMADKDIDYWDAALANTSTAIRVAMDGDRMAGFAKLGQPSLPFDAGGRRALELHNLYVLPDWKGQGIAQVLMDWTVQAARGEGAQDLWLSVFTDNHRARAFYRRYGFVDVKPYHFMVGDHADEDIICRMALDE